LTLAPLAIFDLDFTLLEGDSEAIWSRFLYEQHVVDKAFLHRINAFYRDYEAGRLDFTAYQAFLLHPLVEQSPRILQRLRKSYLHRIVDRLRPKMIWQVDRFKELGYTLVLITATNHFLAEPIAELLGFRNLICTHIKMRGEEFTHELDGIPAFQDGKIRLLENWMDRERKTLLGSWGFSDSYNDLPLLNRVEHPVAVCPDGQLRRYAASRGWEILTI